MATNLKSIITEHRGYETQELIEYEFRAFVFLYIWNCSYRKGFGG